MKIVSEDAYLPFEKYFHRRAAVAEELYSTAASTDAKILATTALDALAKIWFHDFPVRKKELQNHYGGEISESARLSLLLKHFAKDDPDAAKIAVVCFAEDWKLYCSEDSTSANQLLDRRLNNSSNEFLRNHELPKSYLDLPLIELEKECPQITQNRKLRRVAQEYEYGALLYRFYRCPLVHSSKNSDRTHGFARGERVMYYWSDVDPDRTVIGFGLNLITRWLRTVATNYVQFCREQAIIPAENLNAGLSPENNLKERWSKL
ncbi:MAG: hypothetical protein F6K11_07105 [Leptolyngbya sp. SIO3F4]|nr:hypothetical protein [Leptolyngbya sp. SIO3F4]